MVRTPALYRRGQGRQVLLLHGFTGVWMHWNPVLEQLSQHFEVIAPTLPGHLGGPGLQLPPGRLMQTATDSLMGYLDELGVSAHAHVVGNSMGGSLALELAKRGRVASVLAIAPGGGWTAGDGAAQSVRRLFTRQTYAARLAGRRAGAIMSRPGSRKAALRDVMQRGDLLTVAEGVQMLDGCNGCTIVQDVLGGLRADTGVTVLDLDRISVPVQIATSEHDRILPAGRHLGRFLREIESVEHVWLRGVGHVPMWDDTALVTRTITGWLRRQQGRQQG